VEVSSLDDSINDVLKNGGEVVMAKVEIPGVGFHAYCEDNNGNIFGLIENVATSEN